MTLVRVATVIGCAVLLSSCVSNRAPAVKPVNPDWLLIQQVFAAVDAGVQPGDIGKYVPSDPWVSFIDPRDEEKWTDRRYLAEDNDVVGDLRALKTAKAAVMWMRSEKGPNPRGVGILWGPGGRPRVFFAQFAL